MHRHEGAEHRAVALHLCDHADVQERRQSDDAERVVALHDFAPAAAEPTLRCKAPEGHSTDAVCEVIR